VNQLAKNLAMEWSGKGIRVNVSRLNITLRYAEMVVDITRLHSNSTHSSAPRRPAGI